MADGGNCVVQSQPYGNSDSWFKGTVSEYWLCAFLCGMSFLILSQYLYSTYLLYNHTRKGNLTFHNMGPLIIEI